MNTIRPGSPGLKPAAAESSPEQSRLAKSGGAAGPAAGKDTGGLLPGAGGAFLADTLERIAPSRMTQLLAASQSPGSPTAGGTQGGPHVSPGDALTLAAASHANLGSMADTDVTAMAFLVMMDAAKSAREDLKAIMDGVKSINEQKQELRGHAQLLRSAAAEVGRSSELAPGQVSSTRLSLEGVDAAPDAIANDLDSLSGMGETQSLRMQMVMDRLTKLMETLSEVMKKASETSAGITQNLK